MARHLLVTNDFPPKIGGIQSYLWELWRRLPSSEVVVHTTPYRGASAFDANQAFPVVRSREPWLLPRPHLVRRVNRLAAEFDVELVIIDPALPAGLIGPHLDRPYAVVLHGAEVAIPGRAPGSRQLLSRVLKGAVGVIAAGGYPADEGERAIGRSLRTYVVPPGVDTTRFQPLEPDERTSARLRFGLDPLAPTVVSISRLVPRKGMDTLVRAAALLKEEHRGLQVVIAGKGRDQRRLEKLARGLDAPVTLLGRVADADVAPLYGCGDVFAMLCRTRWGGLEQEGFGIVFVEAAACGVAQVAGRSGGAHEAVAHNVTGIVLDEMTPESAAVAIGGLLADDGRRIAMGQAARKRAEIEFSYDVLAAQLAEAIDEMVGVVR